MTRASHARRNGVAVLMAQSCHPMWQFKTKGGVMTSVKPGEKPAAEPLTSVELGAGRIAVVALSPRRRVSHNHASTVVAADAITDVVSRRAVRCADPNLVERPHAA